jgi:hypothetical protein
MNTRVRAKPAYKPRIAKAMPLSRRGAKEHDLFAHANGGVPMRISYTLTASALVLSFGLTSCANTGNVGNLGSFCDENPIVCIGGAAAIIAAIILVASDYDDDDNGSYSIPSVMSDMRLKRDVREAGVLENGVKLYAFRYWNDDRTFVGVSAQDLLKDERFRGAVTISDRGYYMVNFAALGVRIVGDSAQYQEASRKALEAASPAL